MHLLRVRKFFIPSQILIWSIQADPKQVIIWEIRHRYGR